jgi:hypothetical protein
MTIDEAIRELEGSGTNTRFQRPATIYPAFFGTPHQVRQRPIGLMSITTLSAGRKRIERLSGASPNLNRWRLTGARWRLRCERSNLFINLKLTVA